MQLTFFIGLGKRRLQLLAYEIKVFRFPAVVRLWESAIGLIGYI